MNHPKVIFEDSAEARTQYLAYLAKQISCGYYQARRFLILPLLVEKEPRAIYFPDLKYPRQLWKELARYTAEDFDWFFPEKVIKLIPSHQSLATSHSLENQWRAKERVFFDCVREFLPKFNLEKINFIKVLPVEFGTVGSFYFERKGNKPASTRSNRGEYDFYHTIRMDFGPAQLAETILTQIMWTMQPIPKLTLWYQKEAIIDFLMTNSKLGQLFNFEYQSTVSGLPDLSENLVTESENYLQKLGFPIKPILTVNNSYTPTEKRVLEYLIAHKNKLITYDEIGDSFWGDSEEALDKFNLASIAKLMEKIRKKIKDTGIYQELIFTIRGEGYVLYD